MSMPAVVGLGVFAGNNLGGLIMKRQAGFTLIELIMVIVILGILAATAMPKFANLQREARIASMSGVQGAMMAAAAIAHGTQMAQTLASNVDVVIAGTSVSMVNGYPSAWASGIYATLDIDGNKYFWNDPSGVVMSGTTACTVSYVEATAAGVPASTILDTTDC